jgi:hypothetical protein
MSYGILMVFLPVITLLSFSLPPQKISTRYFDFFFSEKDRALVESLAWEADTIADEVISYIGVGVEKSIEVLIATGDEFKRVQPHPSDLPDWVSGVAYHQLSLIVLKSPRSLRGKEYNLKKTFTHEVSHVILGAAFSNGEHIPRWLNEGIAMYMSREWNFNRISTMTHAVLTDSLLPLSEITYTFPRGEKEGELAYCQSFYLVSFLISTYGKEQFHRFVQSLSQEKVVEDVVLKIYGMNLSQLETEWHDYLRLRFSWIPLITSASSLWFLITLIFIVGYIKKRRKAAVTVQQWKEEEGE